MAILRVAVVLLAMTSLAGGCSSSSPEASDRADASTGGAGGVGGAGASDGDADASTGGANDAAIDGSDAGPCLPAYDISGLWMERYNCSAAGSCVDEDVPMTVMVGKTGTDPAEFSFNSISTGWQGKGLLCGEVFNWNASEQIDGVLAYTETGVWIFSGQLFFEKTSYYLPVEGPPGECKGTGSKAVTPPEPPPVGACD